MHADVLIVTVTKVESQAVLEVFQKATGQASKTLAIGPKMYRDLGIINGASVFMVRSEMGAGGLGAAHQTVQEGIAALSPSAVIMVGIAFGIDNKKQTIGDILVSQRLMLYDLQRVGTDKDGKPKTIPRGDRTSATARLINRFRSADEDWNDPKAKVHFGLVLSGEKLVDNMEFRQQIHELEPEAIGGEMEGGGLYVACQEAKVDWILVKGICDWADGNKEENRDERQRVAARNAAGFLLHAMQQASLKADVEPARDSALPIVPAPIRVGTSSASCRSTLPYQPYFFGRERELAAIAEALLPESRTWGVLIDGPGGIGKTALAIKSGHVAPDEHFATKIFLSAKKRELTPSGEQPLEDFMLPNYLDLLSELARELGEQEISRTPPNERANAVRRALADKNALIIVDNVETFEDQERVRLYQFLDRLPGRCKAIVTSRRRADIAAKVIRLDRLALKEALDLMAELAKSNRHMARSTEKDRQDLYEITQGNPLLIKWVVGQLGRSGSQCRTIDEAYEFLKSAPKETENDPLEYIFGDLLGTFTPSETAVLAALVHFTQPAKVEWIADLAGLARTAVQTALEDLADRALLVSDEPAQTFFLPTLAATFLRRKRPDAVASTANRLTDRAYALAIENGYSNYERFPTLEAEWPQVAAALPLFLQGDNDRLQRLCTALDQFLEFSGRWDEFISLCQQAEEKALAAADLSDAGWRAYQMGWLYYLREQAREVLSCAARSEAHWEATDAGYPERALPIRLRAFGHALEKDYPAAIAAAKEALNILRIADPASRDVATLLNQLANNEKDLGDNVAAESDYQEALRIARKVNDRGGIATYTGNLAGVALNREDWPAAEKLAREALSLAEQIGRAELVGSDAVRLATALARQGRPQEGLPYARRAVDIFTKLRMAGSLEWAQTVLEACEGGAL